MQRVISYQSSDGKWYDLEVFDLIDPLDESDKHKSKSDITEKEGSNEQKT